MANIEPVNLNVISIEDLIFGINSECKDQNRTLFVGNYTPKRINNGLSNAMQEKFIENKGEYSLEQKNGKLPITIGCIKVESGKKDAATYPFSYEQICLVIKQPIEFRSAKILPPCEILVTAETGEYSNFNSNGGIRKIRKDYIRALGPIIKTKANLRDMLPDNWFYKAVNR